MLPTRLPSPTPKLLHAVDPIAAWLLGRYGRPGRAPSTVVTITLSAERPPTQDDLDGLADDLRAKGLPVRRLRLVAVEEQPC